MATLAGHGRGDHEQSGHTDQEANESIGECIGQVLCDFDAVGKVERLAGDESTDPLHRIGAESGLAGGQASDRSRRTRRPTHAGRGD